MSGAPVRTWAGRTVPAGGVVISGGLGRRRSSPTPSLGGGVVIGLVTRPSTRP
ncbi:hypothetical protein [Streptomyces cadmiisoli]|uniref:hypothetical protein n=1 Tax=Streptomyces cadmiisoli TaxID=2184053 RepID=UPI0036593A12